MDDEATFTAEELAIIEARTRALAAPRSALEGVTRTEVIVVRVGLDAYALPAARVEAVAPLTKLTPLPHAPPGLAGVTGRASAVVPVFYLHTVLGVPISLSEHGRIVVLGRDDDTLALAVDEVSRIDAVAMDALGPAPSALSPDRRIFVTGVAEDGLPVLDVDALMESERLVVDIRPPRVER